MPTLRFNGSERDSMNSKARLEAEIALLRSEIQLLEMEIRAKREEERKNTAPRPASQCEACGASHDKESEIK